MWKNEYKNIYSTIEENASGYILKAVVPWIKLKTDQRDRIGFEIKVNDSTPDGKYKVRSGNAVVYQYRDRYGVLFLQK